MVQGWKRGRGSRSSQIRQLLILIHSLRKHTILHCQEKKEGKWERKERDQGSRIRDDSVYCRAASNIHAPPVLILCEKRVRTCACAMCVMCLLVGPFRSHDKVKIEIYTSEACLPGSRTPLHTQYPFSFRINLSLYYIFSHSNTLKIAPSPRFSLYFLFFPLNTLFHTHMPGRASYCNSEVFTFAIILQRIKISSFSVLLSYYFRFRPLSYRFIFPSSASSQFYLRVCFFN